MDNRTCAIRIIPGSEKSQRLEYRIGAADANQYIILSAVIASGIWGIKNQCPLQPMVKGSAYDQTFPEELSLPRTLWQAAQRLKNQAWRGNILVIPLWITLMPVVSVKSENTANILQSEKWIAILKLSNRSAGVYPREVGKGYCKDNGMDPLLFLYGLKRAKMKI